MRSQTTFLFILSYWIMIQFFSDVIPFGRLISYLFPILPAFFWNHLSNRARITIILLQIGANIYSTFLVKDTVIIMLKGITGGGINDFEFLLVNFGLIPISVIISFAVDLYIVKRLKLRERVGKLS